MVRGLLCRALQEPNGRTVLVTGCDTGIGHEVVPGHLYLALIVSFVIKTYHILINIILNKTLKHLNGKVARHLDSLGFTVFAGCLDTASFYCGGDHGYDQYDDNDNKINDDAAWTRQVFLMVEIMAMMVVMITLLKASA